MAARTALVLVLLLAAGCGAREQPGLWLVDGHESALGTRGRLEAVARERARTPARALGELLKGPTQQEREAGLITTIPAGVLLETIAVRDGVAHVRLAAPGRAARDLGHYATAQIVYTLTGFDEVSRVVLTVNGRPCCLVEQDGEPVEDPLGREDFRGWQGDPGARG